VFYCLRGTFLEVLHNGVLDRHKAANIQRNIATRQSSEILVRLVQTKLCGPKYGP